MKKKTKQPSIQDRERCMDIRKRSKRGEYIRPEDRSFCDKMWRQYEDWYGSTEQTVFEHTRPYGS